MRPAKVHVRAGVVALLFALFGCAGMPRLKPAPKGAADVCPESANLECAGQPECTYDSKRGCLACVCGVPGAADLSPDRYRR